MKKQISGWPVPRKQPHDPGFDDVHEFQPAWASVLAAIDTAWPAARWREVGVVVGCSGGADSVALLLALAQLRNRDLPPAGSQRPDLRPPSIPGSPHAGLARGFLIVAHFNHGLRGAESDADQTFVGDLAHRLNLRFESAVALGTARDEATLRDQRLDFLAATASRSGARYVALAHTIDDNVETVLHHLLRGTGPAGLAGIAEARAWRDDLVLMRPLLAARRADLRIGLRQIDQAWREDSSNLNLDYRRNWIRGELIPLIQSQYPQAVPAIGRAIAGQQQWRRTIESLAVQWLAEHQLPPGGPMPAQPSSSQTAAAQATAPQRAVGNSVALRRDATIEPAIVIAALQGVWEQQNWPRRAMARTHWTRLAATVRGSDCERYSLPAAIDVIADTASVTVVGPRQSERDLLSLADST